MASCSLTEVVDRSSSYMLCMKSRVVLYTKCIDASDTGMSAGYCTARNVKTIYPNSGEMKDKDLRKCLTAYLWQVRQRVFQQ